MASDALLILIPTGTTKNASFQGPGFDLKTTPSVPRRGLWVKVPYSAASNASGANAVNVTIDDSADNVNFNTVAQSAPVNLTTTAQAGEVFIQIPGNARRFVRASVAFSGAGTAPTFTFGAQVTSGYP